MTNGHRPHEGDERGPPLRENGPVRVVGPEGLADVGPLLSGTELRRAVFGNALRKTGYGFAAGVLLGLFVFRHRTASIAFATGIGLGMGLAEGAQMMRTRRIPGACPWPSTGCPMSRNERGPENVPPPPYPHGGVQGPNNKPVPPQ